MLKNIYGIFADTAESVPFQIVERVSGMRRSLSITLHVVPRQRRETHTSPSKTRPNVIHAPTSDRWNCSGPIENAAAIADECD